ncbi:MAG: hypothetical protein MN733_05685, partial [Nitrososphaera sp.]|nr:hypothetical protein [Nitrososphaera sp.]
MTKYIIRRFGNTSLESGGPGDRTKRAYIGRNSDSRILRRMGASFGAIHDEAAIAPLYYEFAVKQI